MAFYDRRRPHSALNDRTPAEAYTDDGADRSLGLCPGSRQPKVACNHAPGFHLSCDEHLSEGWGPPLPRGWEPSDWLHDASLWSALMGMVRRRWRQRVSRAAAWYLLGAGSLTGVWLLGRSLAPVPGLTREFYYPAE